MKRATALANSYRGACIRIAKAGPDNVDLAMSVYFVQQFNVFNSEDNYFTLELFVVKVADSFEQ